jgi:hypothetical protein
MGYNLKGGSPMSEPAFEMLGVNIIVYVKKVGGGPMPRFCVYSANGAKIGLIEEDLDATFTAVRQNNMEPLNVH